MTQIMTSSAGGTLPLARYIGTILLGIGLFSMAAAVSSRAVVAPPNFGPNVYIFDPSMPTSQIQATLNQIANQQISNQFGIQR